MAFNFVLGALILFAILVVWSLRILREYERAVVFQLGRFWMVKGPGLIVIWPVIPRGYEPRGASAAMCRPVAGGIADVIQLQPQRRLQ